MVQGERKGIDRRWTWMTVQGPWKPHYAQAYARAGRDGVDVTRISSAAFVKDVPALKALRLTSKITNDAAALANPSLMHVDLWTRSKAPLDFSQTPNMVVAAFEWRPGLVGLDSCEQLEMVQLYTWDGSGFRWLGRASPLLDLYVDAEGAGDECTLDGLENVQRLRSLTWGACPGCVMPIVLPASAAFRRWSSAGVTVPRVSPST